MTTRIRDWPRRATKIWSLAKGARWPVWSVALGILVAVAVGLVHKPREQRKAGEQRTMNSQGGSGPRPGPHKDVGAAPGIDASKQSGPAVSDWPSKDPALKAEYVVSQGTVNKDKLEKKKETEPEPPWLAVDVGFDKEVYRLGQDKEIRVKVERVRWPKPKMVLTTDMVAKAHLNWDLLREDDLQVLDCNISWGSLCSDPPNLKDEGDPLELPYTLVFPLSKALQGSKGEVGCGRYYVSLILPSYIQTVGSEPRFIYVRP